MGAVSSLRLLILTDWNVFMVRVACTLSCFVFFLGGGMMQIDAVPL